jgi:hypothetical protein
MNIFTKNILWLSLSLFMALSFNSCKNDLPTVKREGKVFPNFEYSKVVAYDYDGAGKGDLIIEKGKIHHTVKKEQELSKEQIAGLLDVLNDQGSYGEDVYRCFKPHLGVVFYDAQGKAKAQISICFLCNTHNSFPLIAAQETVRANHPKEFHGYSKEGKRKLMDFCKSLNFSNCGGTEAVAAPKYDEQ